MHTARYWIEKLALLKHPEGGWYKEVYRSNDVVAKEVLPNNYTGERNVSTSIYYLLEGTDFSSFHRIKSDELWHFYTGSSGVEILWIEDKELRKAKLGSEIDRDEHFQLAIKKNQWFAARLLNKHGYALMGCTVSPGFHFDDFELADDRLLKKFPEIKDEIAKMINC